MEQADLQMIENYMNWNWKGILFEEFGNGFKVTIFGKVSSKSEKVSSVLEEVGSTFDNYLPFLKEVKITDVFINNIEIVFNNCGVGVPFGQSSYQKQEKILSHGESQVRGDSNNYTSLNNSDSLLPTFLNE